MEYRSNVENPFAVALKEHFWNYDLQELILQYSNIGFCPIHAAVIPRFPEFKCLFCNLTYNEFPLHEPMQWTESLSGKQIVSFGWQDKELQHHIAEVIQKRGLRSQYSGAYNRTCLITKKDVCNEWTVQFGNDTGGGVIYNGLLNQAFFNS